MKQLLTVLAIAIALPLWAQDVKSPLAPIRTDTPRDTMRTFLKAMHDYAEGVEKNDAELKERIDDAVSCLDLSDVSPLLRQETGREAAVFLKEVMDRIIWVDYDKIPNDTDLKRWRLRDTDIKIIRIDEGDRAGEYLFSKDTVARAREFYRKVRHLPYLEGAHGAYYKEPWLESHVPDWTRKQTFGVGNWQWAGLFIAVLLGLVIRLVSSAILKGLKSLASRSKTVWDDKIVNAIDGPVALVGASAFWFLSVILLQFEGSPRDVLFVIVQLCFSVSLIWLAYRLVTVLCEYLEVLTSRTESTLDDHLVPLVRRALRIFVILFGALVTVQNLGFNILSLLAGLGLGGLAFALAARDMCANFFGSLMIFLDRPFQIGDWVIVGSAEGTVEEIGFRSTRIRTFYNSVISVPNSEMANANVDNMGRRQYRRIKAFFGLTYDTPPEKMEAFLEGVKNIVKANPYTRKDYYHVVFNAYQGDNLEVMLYCFLKVPDWATELVERQNIYLEILRLAYELDVRFAFPTQTLYVESVPGQKPFSPPHQAEPDAMAAAAYRFGPNGDLAKPGGLGLFTPPYQEPADPR